MTADGPSSDGRLRLRKLALRGFKSFADETVFLFDRPVVAIVGPNGCGKSNVVDAIKWVLGEQSAKSLRGGAMADVIFNGSEKREPANAAQVTLTFANPKNRDGQRPLPFDSDEVDVGRVLLRDGTSHYKLGGRKVRLKDVKDAFLDTGLGQSAYGVIEQGQVARLLDADPRERRAIFEEAAGVSRFRVQRKEAAAKLGRTDANLLRLSDVNDEFDRQVRSTRAAATKARTYQEAAERLSAVRLKLALHTYHGLVGRRATAEDELAAAEAETASSAEGLRQAEHALAAATAEADERAAELREVEHERVRLESRQSSAKQRADFAGRRQRELEDRHRQATAEAERVAEQAAELEAAGVTDAAALAESAEAAAKAREAVDAAREAYADVQRRQAEARRAVDEASTAAVRAGDEVARLERAAAARAAERQSASDRLDEATAKLDKADAEAAAAASRVRELEAKVAEAAVAAENAAARVDVRRDAAEDASRAATKAGERLAAARERAAELRSRRKTLADLESRREGVTAGVREVLGKFDFAAGLVADELRAEPAWSRAIEAALDGRDQWILLKPDADPAAAVEATKTIKGRVTLVPHAAVHGEPVAPPSGLTTAASVARPEPLATWLLGDVLLADELPDVPPSGFAVAARDGRLMRRDGTIAVGSGGGGLVTRRGELDAVVAELEKAEAEVAEAQQAVEAGTSAAREAAKEAAEVREASYACRRDLVEVEQRHAAAKDAHTAAAREPAALRNAIADLQGRLAELAQDDHAEALANAKKEQSDRSSERDRLLETARGDAERATASAEQLSAARVELSRLEEQHAALRRQAERDRARRDELAARQRSAAESLEAVAAAQAEAAGEVDDAAAEVERLAGEAETSSASVTVASNRAGEASGKRDAARAEVQRVGEAARVADERRRHAESAAVEARLRVDAHVTHCGDDLGIDVESGHADYVDEEADWPALEREARDLKARIDRAGGVNLDAIGELEELEERRDTLAAQLEDVRKAKEELERLIQELDEESGKRFIATFEATREHFNGMFRRLFGGGRADLTLRTSDDEEETDPMAAGVDVIARPPGKQPAALSQLSGGEKAMTCVALLMSLFKSRPSPLCVLDEVDAPLDEANTERFCRVLDDFLGHSQFVVVTHSKPTMRHADVLYGVTMPERGVSRRVEVRFDQVGENGKVSVAG